MKPTDIPISVDMTTCTCSKWTVEYLDMVLAADFDHEASQRRRVPEVNQFQIVTAGLFQKMVLMLSAK